MKKSTFLFALFLSVSTISVAQFTGTNLSEYQYGNIPGDTTGNFHSLYTKFVLNYGYKNLKLTSGLQFYTTPYSSRNYLQPSWLAADYRSKGWEVKLGNYNETLGRGLLLRSYEIPGAVLEDKGYRSKNYFYRDILGAMAAYQGDRFSVKALWGYALNNVYPPTQSFEYRRSDRIGAIEGNYKVLNQTIGLSGLRLENTLEDSYYAMSYLSGNLFDFLSYYTAYAFYAGGNREDIQPFNSHAFYGSLNFSLTNFGVSFEWKDYQSFIIGSGINEPPALVREHSYRLLNRSTHVLQPENESGFQVEAFYHISSSGLLTANYTFANNDFGSLYKYRELFIEYQHEFNQLTELKLFFDSANDPFKGELKRSTAGFVLSQVIKTQYGLEVNGEWQTFERDDASVQNYLAGITLRKSSNLFVSLLSEFSNDPFQTSSFKTWLAGSVRYKLNSQQSLQLFVGERRGGPACNAGICYEVLDFKGIELRWQARF